MMRKVINNDIQYDKILLIDEEGENLGQVSREEGLRLAREKELDLLLISDKDPVVCRICDAGKFIYNVEKNKKKIPVSKMKSLSVTTRIHLEDRKRKCEQVKEMVERGFKVKMSVFCTRKDLKNEDKFRSEAKKQIEEIISYLEEFAKIDHKGIPSDEKKEDGKKDNSFFIIFSPLKKTTKKV